MYRWTQCQTHLLCTGAELQLPRMYRWTLKCLSDEDIDFGCNSRVCTGGHPCQSHGETNTPCCNSRVCTGGHFIGCEYSSIRSSCNSRVCTGGHIFQPFHYRDRPRCNSRVCTGGHSCLNSSPMTLVVLQLPRMYRWTPRLLDVPDAQHPRCNSRVCTGGHKVKVRSRVKNQVATPAYVQVDTQVARYRQGDRRGCNSRVCTGGHTC